MVYRLLCSLLNTLPVITAPPPSGTVHAKGVAPGRFCRAAGQPVLHNPWRNAAPNSTTNCVFPLKNPQIMFVFPGLFSYTFPVRFGRRKFVAVKRFPRPKLTEKYRQNEH